MSLAPENGLSPFLATTREFPEDQRDQIVTHEHTYTELAQAVNDREIGYYSLTENLTGKFYDNVVNNNDFIFSYRKIFYFGAIATGATLLIPHGITGQTMFTEIYGTMIDNSGNSRPIPYVSTLAIGDQLLIIIQGANINLTSGSSLPPIVSGMVVLEYVYQ